MLKKDQLSYFKQIIIKKIVLAATIFLLMSLLIMHSYYVHLTVFIRFQTASTSIFSCNNRSLQGQTIETVSNPSFGQSLKLTKLPFGKSVTMPFFILLKLLQRRVHDI